MDKICAFFGHHELWRDVNTELELAVRHAINEGCSIFWCGGYGTFDQCAAGTVKRLKTEFPDLHLELILAYLSQSKIIPDLYDRTMYPDGLESVPQRFAISKRNRWMVQNCDLVITCVDHGYGGAYAAFCQAARQQKKIL